MRHVLAVLAAAVLFVLTAGCGGSDAEVSESTVTEVSEPIPFDDIDTEAWTADLVATGGVRSNPDLKALYDLTVDNCTDEDFAFSVGLTLVDARPDQRRVNMTYVCPSQAHKVDDALAEIQESTMNVDRACATDPGIRTQDQQQLVDAVGCY
ncbi:MAG: hypothetical protein L0H74_05980 [Brachybacterium sp.]|nr:hypothetical protein [Brachybacterium sp.]